MRTIGKYYQETVLSLSKEKRKKVELPTSSSDVRIEKDLFGWKLYSRKEFMTCRSEEEARYFKVFVESGLHEVYVPKDEEYLKEILPRLEKIKTKIDEVIDFYAEGILDRRIRERLRAEVYIEVTK